jgi:nucleotide-binding universal stress UspA family protein
VKILVAIDGSVHSNEAVNYLVAHANQYREKPAVDLVYVHQPLARLPALVLSADQIRRYHEDEGNAVLARAKSLLDQAGIAYAAHILVGEVARTIVDLGEQAGSDLILLGSRGASLGDNPLLGSTATKVLYFSNIPVLVVKSQASF